jgi:hypothetical protein
LAILLLFGGLQEQALEIWRTQSKYTIFLAIFLKIRNILCRGGSPQKQNCILVQFRNKENQGHQ